MVIRDKKLVFVHVPKTGGTFIENVLLAQLTGRVRRRWKEHMGPFLPNVDSHPAMPNAYHHTASFLCDRILGSHRDYRDQLWSDYTSFAVIRDPVEVRISAYLWLSTELRYEATFEHYILSGDFRHSPRDQGPDFGSSFGKRQSDYVEGTNGEILVTQLFHFDRIDRALALIDEHFAPLSPRLLRKLERFHRNPSDRELKDRVRRDMTPMVRRVIHDEYRADFELLAALSSS